MTAPDREAVEAAVEKLRTYSEDPLWSAGYRETLRAVLAELERLGRVEQRFAELSDGMTVAAELLDRLADDAECQIDHEGCSKFCLPDHRNLCLAHNEVLPCPHPLARGLVGAWHEVQAENADLAARDEREGDRG